MNKSQFPHLITFFCFPGSAISIVRIIGLNIRPAAIANKVPLARAIPLNAVKFKGTARTAIATFLSASAHGLFVTSYEFIAVRVYL